MYAKWNAERGWTKEEIAYRLIEVSDKARERYSRNRNDRYPQITAAKAVASVERKRGETGPPASDAEIAGK
jgi:hypothetical protein